MPVRLFAVAGEEIAKPRTQVAADVFDDDGDAVRVGVELGEQRLVWRLRDRLLAERLVVAEHADDAGEVRGREINLHRASPVWPVSVTNLNDAPAIDGERDRRRMWRQRDGGRQAPSRPAAG